MRPSRGTGAVALLLVVMSACAASSAEPARQQVAVPPKTETVAAPAPPTRAEVLAQLDAYLQDWDALARGDDGVATAVVDASRRTRFEATLAELLRAGDPAAPARLVCYQVVQVFGFLGFDSPLGAAARQLLGAPADPSRRHYDPADLYRWWNDNRTKYEAFPLLERWEAWDQGRALIARWLDKTQGAAAPGSATPPVQEVESGGETSLGPDARVRGSLPKEAIRTVISSHLNEVRDAGYNVLAYDLRNHGTSSAANGGISGIGRWEWRDCVGVKKYVDSHPALGKMRVGLYSQCMGGNSQYEAIYRRPDLFENVSCMCSPMVVSMSAIYSAFSELREVSQYQELIDLELLKMGAFTAAEMTPQLFAPGVRMPVLMFQVLKDSWTRNPEDAQKTFDLLGSKVKELFWIENTTRRFKDGYNHFGRHPEKILAFFDEHMR